MNTLSHISTSASIRAGQAYFKIRSWWPVWFYVVNGKNRRAFNAYKQNISEVQKRIVSDMKRDGIAVAHLDELFPGSDMLTRFQQYAQERMAAAETKTNKSFLRNLWDAVPVIDFNNPFISLALGEGVLATVNEYMQMFSHFFYLTLNVTMPVSKGSEAMQSQRWHGDPDDQKMCKVFLYLNDVDEGAGPFIYVSGTQHGGRWRDIFHEQPPRGFVPLERPVGELVPKSDIKHYTGKAGTIIFCDTSGYHRGGYATKNERIMLTMGYCSRACPFPMRIRLEHLSDEQKRRLSPAGRHALTFSRSPFTQYFFRVLKPNFKYGAD